MTMDPLKFVQMELRAKELVNAFRAKNGKPPLEINLKFAFAAQEHSENEGAQGKMTHDGFQDRAQASGANKENVALGQKSIEEVVQTWINSPGHRKNILDAKREVAVGNDNGHWTMLLA